MSFSESFRNQMLDVLPDTVWFSAHSEIMSLDQDGFQIVSEADELAVTRVSTTLSDPANGGLREWSPTPEIQISAGMTVRGFSAWTQATGGSIIGRVDLPTGEQFTAEQDVTLRIRSSSILL